MIEYDKLFEKCKISSDIKNKFDSNPVYNKYFLKSKVKSHKNTKLFHKTFLSFSLDLISWVVVTMDSALKKDENYYM